ncbi:MAG: hypothetical protein ACJ8DC_05455 [Gemmatimonadales bacterium]
MGDAVAKATMLFTLVFAFSLVIERFLEVLKSAYDMLDSRYDWHRSWTARAGRIRDFLERRLRIFEYVSPDQATAFIAKFSEMLVVPPTGENAGVVPVISGDLVRAMYVRVGCKIIAIGIGVPLALGLGLDIFTLLREVTLPAGACQSKALAHLCNTPLERTLATIATGIAIGLGSGPVHKIITTIEKKRDDHAQKELANV